MKNIFVMDNFLWIMLVMNMFAHASTLWAYYNVGTFNELNILMAGTLSNIYVFLLMTGLSWVSIVAIYNVFKDNKPTHYHLLRLILSIIFIMDFFIDLLSTIGGMVR